VKTFSDKPADAAPKTTEGWAASNLDHVDPKTGSQGAATTRTAEKPVAPADDASLRKVESIPTPAAKEPATAGAPAAAAAPAEKQPTVAPPGPAVYPPPPASDTRDVPAAETSGPGPGSSTRGHTT
jgi:hypothetical protein